jgi:hypothetical protein
MSYRHSFHVETTVKNGNPQIDKVLADRWQEACGKAAYLRAACEGVALQLVQVKRWKRVSPAPPKKARRLPVSLAA